MKIEANKYHKLRDGKKAFVACIRTDVEDSAFPAIGYIEGVSGSVSCGLDGEYVYGQEDDRDIIAEWKEPKTMWANISCVGDEWYLEGIYATREKAKERASDLVIACVKVTEGEGL